jgi:branched-chain amino acid transport system substrate-binding protein
VAKEPSRLDAGTMVISPTATSPSLISTFQNEGNVWRVPPPDTFQASALAKLIKMDFPDAGGVTIDVVYEDTDYGSGFGQPMADALIAQGFSNNRRPFRPDDSNSQTMVINGLANVSPKATVLIAFPGDAISLITKAKTFPTLTRAAGHRWYLTDATKDPAVLTSATLSELDQSIGTAPAQGAGGAFAAFRDSFRTRYGTDPLTFSYTSHSYDALWLVMLSTAYAESTGSITGAKLGEGMNKMTAAGASIPLRVDKWTEASNILLQGLSINAEGASGALDFDVDAGHPSAPYEVWQVSDGGIRVLRLTNP